MMNHEELFTAALGLEDPLYVKKIDFDHAAGELHLYIDFQKGARFSCSTCGAKEQPVHDTKEKTWRHLNFFQFKTYIHFRTPRINCAKDGVRMINVPWSKPGSGFTLLFEAMVLQLARVMPVSQIALLVGEHDTRIWRIVQRYVQIAIKQADYSEIKSVGIDETSSKKRHHYVTLFVDMDENRVVYVTPGKDASVIGTFKQMLQSRNIPSKQVEQVCADMSPAFRKGVQEQFPEAQLTFDRFHVMKLINEAVDKVRREEQSTEQVLKRSRYIWLRNPENLSTKQSDMLHSMSILNLKTGRAYRIKLALQNIYRHADNLDEATTMLRSWYSWAVRSRLDPIREFARTVKNHWSGILNYFDSRLTNGILEGTNSIVQTARARARGYRNVNNFITMIYLLGGKLELPVFSER